MGIIKVLKQASYKIPLLLDDASLHIIDDMVLVYAEVLFPPSNTTSKAQLIHVGVIASFK